LSWRYFLSKRSRSRDCSWMLLPAYSIRQHTSAFVRILQQRQERYFCRRGWGRGTALEKTMLLRKCVCCVGGTKEGMYACKLFMHSMYSRTNARAHTHAPRAHRHTHRHTHRHRHRETHTHTQTHTTTWHKQRKKEWHAIRVCRQRSGMLYVCAAGCVCMVKQTSASKARVQERNVLTLN
jgi:hypothetical protein